MNYSWDEIYPFDDCECDRACVKTNIMVLSAVSKLQSDCDKITKQVNNNTDRKSVVQGKSVDLGGRRIIKKKKR